MAGVHIHHRPAEILVEPTFAGQIRVVDPGVVAPDDLVAGDAVCLFRVGPRRGEVPFADERCRIPGLPHPITDRLLGCGQRSIDVRLDPEPGLTPAREEPGPRRHAHGRRYVAAAAKNPIGCQCIEVRRADIGPRALGTEVGPPLVVGNDDDHVRPAARRLPGGTRAGLCEAGPDKEPDEKCHPFRCPPTHTGLPGINWNQTIVAGGNVSLCLRDDDTAERRRGDRSPCDNDSALCDMAVLTGRDFCDHGRFLRPFTTRTTTP